MKQHDDPGAEVSQQFSLTLSLAPEDNKRLAALCGELGAHLAIIQSQFNIKLLQRGYQFTLFGTDEKLVYAAKKALLHLYQKASDHHLLDAQAVHMELQGLATDLAPETERVNVEISAQSMAIKTRKSGVITPKGKNQQDYLHNMLTYDVNFGIGPAGTGKTFLAVLCAVNALEREQVNRIILVRPAVEAGESLGFLPGDFAQKVEPYLRPLYDALHDLMGPEWVQKYMEKGQIEVAPLAYMRGRTLNDAFIILDEAQNTTKAQMKMFLTRLGFGSTAVITGDLTQIDLPAKSQSGLIHALDVLKKVDGIGFACFKARDAVRHRLVQKIITAYDLFDRNNKRGQEEQNKK